MTKWSAIITGFILAVMVKSFFAQYEFVGLLIVGFITGFIAREGTIGGFWNASVAGALGTIVSAILFVLIATLGGSLFSIFGGLTGFTISGIASIIIVLGYLIYYGIVMGITGAVGGAIASKK
ncbi:DUF5518 domain-containing protein [Methanobrevibacter sp.]|uniref:DUF5518 domain-containing protein n=1 Tax=Methanobrevibacter sp. TaxID=66852 RepID=UPI0026DFBC3E|nr:DUF5518 domain-containing protein [Methanobrevibacter sp.]MDO5822954.1 DUF5518 domain-containing protein [Methanobrevibacter sp.]